MATAVADADPAPAAAAKPKKAAGGGVPWMAVLIAVVMSSGISVGVSYMLMQKLVAASAAHAPADAHAAAEAEKPKPRDPPVYVPFDPAFVANLDAAGETRFLQVQVQVMTRDAHAADKIKAHEPRLRNTLLLLFSQQHPEDVATRAGVEKLQASALAEVQRVLSDETGEPIVEALYFTSFVVQ